MLARGAAELEAGGLANLALIRGDATALPFRDGSFDGLCCFAALHLFADPFPALDEMRRGVRGGGGVAVIASGCRHGEAAPPKPPVERGGGGRVVEFYAVGGALVEGGGGERGQTTVG